MVGVSVNGCRPGGSVVWTTADAQELTLMSGQWKPINVCNWGNWDYHQIEAPK